MLGNRKVNLELINAHFQEKKKVHFLQVKNNEIANLYTVSKKFSNEIKKFYDNEEQLIDTFSEFRKTINRFFVSLESYEVIFKEHLQTILKQLQNIKLRYPNLFELYCIPIANSLKKIQSEYGETNFILESLHEQLGNKLTENTYILTRFRSDFNNITIGDREIPVYKANDFIKLGIFANHVIFIGSPHNFEKKCSSLFFATNTYYITYDFFDNQIPRLKNFQLLKKSDTENTIYANVHIECGFKGALFEADLGEISEEFDNVKILEKYEANSQDIKEIDRAECKLVMLSNKFYIFIPISAKLRRLDKENLSFNSVELKSIERGDWILFRNNSSVDLIVEVANNILGEKATIHRKYQNIWKNRLIYYVKKYGLKKYSQYLINKGVTTANDQNIRNWISPELIAPNQLEILLATLKFTPDEVKTVQKSTQELRSAHLKAGNYISQKLLEEIDSNIIDDIDEEGYVTFYSELFEGASFNIEVVQDIINKTIIVNHRDILKIWRG